MTLNFSLGGGRKCRPECPLAHYEPKQVLSIHRYGNDYGERVVDWSDSAGHRLAGMPPEYAKQHCPHLIPEIQRLLKEARGY